MMLWIPVSLLALAQGPRPDLEQALTPAIERFVEENRIPGLAIGIVDDGEVIYARGFGRTRAGGGKPVTTRSVFHMASVSKPFTATAVMQLVERGELELDDTIVDTLPYFRLADEESKTITLLQVLTHTSGFPDVRDYEWNKPQDDEGAAERFVRSLTGEELLFPPGEGSRYSNMAYDTMGDVIAKASGVSFEEFQRENILAPLGMDDSSFLLADIDPELRTEGHSLAFSKRVSNGPCPVYPYNRRHAPSSTLNSNVEDMCRWMIANLNRGALGDRRILEEESYATMWSRDDDTPAIGLSWWVEDVRGLPVAIHTGSDTGYSSRCILFVDEGLGIVLMSNTNGARLSAVEGAATRAFFGEDPAFPGPNIGTEIAWVLDEEGLDAAIERYLELRETEPGRWDFGFDQLDEVCDLLLYQERPDEAVELAALNADQHEMSPAFIRLAEAQVAVGDPEGARASLEHALRLAPHDALAREALAKLDS